MDFENRVLVLLADENTRAALFDQTSMEQIIKSTYQTDLLTVEGPFSTVFDRVELGFSLKSNMPLNGSWQPSGMGQDTRFHVDGFRQAGVQASAYWFGGVVARISFTTAKITSVNTHWPNLLTIDPQIIADLGALPDDPIALETARRTHLITLLQDGMAQPAALSDEALDHWLDANKADSVSHLLSNIAQSMYPASLQIAITEPDPGPTAPLVLPVSAAIFIRPADFSLSELLQETKTLLSLTSEAGFAPAREARLPVRHPVIAVWILPEDVFDDDDWTGADDSMSAAERREARRATAGTWLAGEGIGLVTVPGN